ncbi:RagB/SusD family nutrient uptake outer membrane protein [Aurantibacter crassamenti]|uniref:RagB/SusD family nutrient uptake outer membrane protein n=1 Tax=Aurantibacter crassamenti TaxID=1837375 RepID=UPI00193A784D|nr:RagB/SusD family nutrient uptake outer membrane protein [Aurantibacter crassamenti]MBM1104753.1 RagB/SusD family nutrient uptake outer membrane protein [Aurantibacter crassamenti]
MKNNKLKIFGLSLVATLGLVSCTDLEIEETDSFITEGFVGLENPSSALEGLYGDIRGNLSDQANTYALFEVTTDAQLIPTRGADWGDNGRWRKLHQHEWGLEESDIIGPFEQWTKNQLSASQIIDERSAASASDVLEARFLRAYSMWITLDLYGQVPFRDTQLPSTEIPEVLTGADAVNFILADLDLCIAGLSNTPAGAGDDLLKPSTSAAKFLKARILLNRHIYENQLTDGGGTPNPADMTSVISLVDDITANGYTLQEGYFDIFLKDADSETIWFTESNVENVIYAPLHVNSFGLAGGGGWNGFSTLAEYYDLFEGDPEINRVETDLTRLDGQEERRGGTPPEGLPFTGTSGADPADGYEFGSNVGYGFLINQQYDLDGTKIQDRQGADLQFKRDFTDGSGAKNLINNNEQTGVRIIKYNPRNGLGTQHKIQFRYADAYLMKAEAMFRSGGDPLTMINELRTIRDAQPLTSISESDILDERGRELYLELVRRTDLIRFGQYLRDWEFKVPSAIEEKKRLLFPIPLPQILANPNLVQNPGYE